MKFLLTVFLCLILASNSFANLSEGEIVLDLYPQQGNQIYAVGYTYEGKQYWYQVGIPGSKERHTSMTLLLVYYDLISKNFFVLKDGNLAVITINRAFKLKLHDRRDPLPTLAY